MNRLFWIFIAALGFLLGSSFFRSPDSIRNPAAIPKTVTTETPSPSELRDKIVTEILNNTTTERRSTGVALKLGSGIHCDSYDQVLITLIGEGIASHGEPAELRIQTLCSDLVIVPFEKIYKNAASDGVVDIGDTSMVVTAAHITDEWPPEWYIGTVRLINSQNTDDLISVEATDYRKTKGRSVAVYW